MENLELIKKSPLHWELILNRPDKYNALTSDMYEGITQILDQAANDEQLVLLSLTGKGKFYSSGTDLSDPAKAFLSTNDIEATMEEERIRLKKFIEKFITFPKILIGFINGPAIGISVTTLALFDGVYASSSSTFSLPFIRTAQAPEGCSSFLFPTLMGSLHAKEILLFDRKLTAQEAQQRGLVTRVIDDQIFQQEKEKICQQILSLPKGSLLSSKALIQRWNINTLKYVNEEELQNLKHRWVTEEFVEAISKFMDGRKKSKL
jgi:peroxisomal 3,2-trans-enoyl-CoA isomerase